MYLYYLNKFFMVIGNGAVFDLALSTIEKGREGIVMRNSNTFHYNDFNNNVAKFVRTNHVTTSTHWSHQELVLNKLR